MDELTERGESMSLCVECGMAVCGGQAWVGDLEVQGCVGWTGGERDTFWPGVGEDNLLPLTFAATYVCPCVFVLVCVCV